MQFARQASLPFSSLPVRGVVPTGSSHATRQTAKREATSGAVVPGSSHLPQQATSRPPAPPAGAPVQRLVSPTPARAQAGVGEVIETVTLSRLEYVLEIVGAGFMMAALLVFTLFF
jgi:hypothetical protein